jgi:cold shock CspA family protein/ribosome-associated translation inhibitor RaiA
MELHWQRPDLFREEERLGAEKRIAELARDRTDLIDVRITARTTAHHRHGGQEVRITCVARGKEIVAARTRPDAGMALKEALDALEREVWRMRHRRTQERDERPAPPPELGVIDELRREQGFGFILTDGGERVYFHRNAVHGGLEFERLEEGQRVALNLEGGVQGPQATVVVAPPPDTPAP